MNVIVARPNQVVTVTIVHSLWRRVRMLFGLKSTITLRYDERGHIVDITYS
jgi:hypothetical protein